MAYTLRTGEMIAILNELDMHEEAHIFVQQLEAIGAHMANTISAKLGIVNGPCTYDLAMVAATFFAKEEGQPIPDVFEHMGFDSADEWRTKEEEDDDDGE